MGAECFRVSHVRPTYSGSHGFQGRWALGAAGASPCQRRGPRRSDNPASSSFPATGLRLVGPAGLLPQPCIRAELHVGSPAEGRGGGLRWPPIVRSVRLPPGRSLCALPSYSPSRPLCPLPPLFPTSCFLPSSGATEGCLEWGKWWGPPGGRRALPLPPPSLPTPIVSFKKFGQSGKLEGRPGGSPPPGLYSLSGRISTLPLGPRCAFWDLAVPALPVCLLPLLHPVLQCPEPFSVSAVFSLPHCPPMLQRSCHPQAFLVQAGGSLI